VRRRAEHRAADAASVALSPEIVREFQVVNNGLSAEFRGAAGGAINVVTRTGANEWHGDVFTFLQNERFDARGPFSDPTPSSRPRFCRYRPGGALGGPLKRDRAFFYVALEQEHLTAEEESEIGRAARTRINSLLASGFAPRLSVRSLTARRFPTGLDETETASKLTYLTGGRNTLDFSFAFYLAGRATGNGRARETGLLGAEALIDGGVVFSVLKNISQRQRPDHDEGQGEFFEGGHSFPSGHATGAWALATVVANEYRHRRLVQVGAYGLATAVSVSRFTGRNHFLSDVLIGSAIGYGIGRYVYRTHHDQALDASGADTSQEDETEAGRESARSRLVPFAAPSFSRARREYGLALSWSF
jgi:membrane-associated phospholipid phosphatase